MGKAEVPREETIKCTAGAAGVWVLASRESVSEIMTGKSYFQPGRQTTSQDPTYRRNLKRKGGFRTGASGSM